MKKDAAAESGRECVRDPANVIVMPMADHHGLGRREVHTKGVRILYERRTLTGVEQDAMPVRLNPEGQAPLSGDTGERRSVFDEHRYLDLIEHRVIRSQSPLQEELVGVNQLPFSTAVPKAATHSENEPG